MKAKHCTLGHVLGVLLVLCGSLFLGCTNENDLSGDQNDGTDPGRIATLEDQAASIEASIRDLEEVYEKHEELIEKLSTEVSGLEDLLDALESSGAYEDPTETQAYKELKERYSSLQNAKSLLSEKIDSLEAGISKLQEYVYGKLATEDWAEKTFLTLEQYGETLEELLSIQKELEGIKTFVEDNEGINDRIYALESAVKTAQDYLQAQIDAINSEIEKIKDRLDNIEADINSINQQITAINVSIDTLKVVDAELNRYIESLQTTADNLQSQIDATNTALAALESDLEGQITASEQKVLGELNTVKKALEGQLAAINSTIATLQAKDTELEGRIAALETYVDTQLRGTKDWAEKTFLTLEQYDATQTDISEIKALIKSTQESITALEEKLGKKIADDIAAAVAGVNADIAAKVTEITDAYTAAIATAKEDITAAYTDAIKTAITASETSMKEWVNKTLAEGYYTKAEIDGKITALQTQVTEGDAALQNLAAALIQAENDLRAAYTDAINTAITGNNGIISAEIAAAVKTAQDNLQAQIDAINSDIEKIKDRLDIIEADIKSINQQIVAIEESIGKLEDVRSYLEENINHLEDRLSSLEDQQGSSSPSPSDPEDVSALQEEINKLKEEYQALDEQIAILREYVDGELAATEDWAEATSQTLEQYGETLKELLSIQNELEDIKTFVEENEGINDRINALESAIKDAKNSMESWVNEKIANLENKVVELEVSTKDMKKEYDKLQNEIDEICEDLNSDLESQSEALDKLNSVQTALQKKQTELDEKVKDIENLISDYNAEVDDVITLAALNEGRLDNVETVLAEIEAEVSEHDGYVEAIMHEISNLASEVGAILSEIEELRSQIDSILGMVQSVVYMPTNMDGAVYVNASSRTTDISFKISPSSAVASLQNVWQNVLSIKYLTMQKTKAAPAMKMLPITSAEFDETIGTVTVTVDCKTIDPSFFTGKTSASAALFISDGRTSVSSDFVPMLLNISVDLTSQGTANCYIVSESGKYQFKATKGNSSELLPEVAYAEVLWESFGTDVTPEEGDLVSAVMYDNGNIYFKTADTFKEGNAVIAAKDASGTILWSWHIWFTDQPEEQVYYNNAGTMMDRNLGATSATPGDVGALGLFYQWGRKDPFLGSSSISSSIEAESTITWPSAVASDSSSGTIAYATANPTTFIKYNSSNDDWYYAGSSTTDNTRWTTSATTKSIYDPCPSGWRVPDGGSNGIWSKALGSSSDFTQSSLYDSINEGMNFSGKFGSASTIWYPASGFRNSYVGGGLNDVGNGGYYWSASPLSNIAYGLFFYDDGNVYPSDCGHGASGHSVRCIKEGTGDGSSDSGDSNDNNVQKERVCFVFRAQEVKWSYTPDAAQDAEKYLGNPYSYDRTLQVTADEIAILGDFPGESYYDIVTTGTLLSTTVNGIASTAVTFGYDAVSGNATVTYTGFEWDKTYDIVANYETSATDVEIRFTLTTVDRKREPIIVKTNPTVSTPVKPLVYKKDMAIAQGTYNVPFGDKLFEELETAGNIAGIDKAAYLTDVFNSGKAYYDILNSWYDNDLWGGGRFLKDDGGADTWNTRLVIDGATCQFTFGYSYKSFSEVITNLKYVREFTTWYGQEFVLEHVLTIDLPKYDFAHTSYYVKANDDNTGWYSNVIGQYSPIITATDVYAFKPNLDMNKVFNVVDRATATPTIIPAADLASYSLVTEFALESTVPGISIRNNEISYLSSEDQIGVTGKLYIENTNGTRLYLRTRFDDTYANYVVKKCDPIGALTVTENPEVDVVDAKVYNINVLEFFRLMDNRNGVPTFDLIVDGAFLNGDGINGYNGLVTTIYGLGVDYAEVTVPANYVGIITFDGAGTLSFDNSGQLLLVEDVIIPVTLKINYTWGSREGTVNVKFKKNYKE